MALACTVQVKSQELRVGCEQLKRLKAENSREALYVVQRHVPNLPLDMGDKSSMQTHL